MRALKQTRERRGWSQRGLARQAGISFRGLQLIEAGESDPRLSSLAKIAGALGLSAAAVVDEVDRLLGEEPDSIAAVSRGLGSAGKDGWKLLLFDFVDAFRRSPDACLVAAPPVPETPPRLGALMASTVETLCAEQAVAVPWWCGGIGPLPTPWFVAGIENLKASALVESPVHFRKRNIFVLGNFLARA